MRSRFDIWIDKVAVPSVLAAVLALWLGRWILDGIRGLGW